MKAHGLARIGRDVELRYTNSGEPVASLSLAFTYGKKGSDGKRPTQWVEGVLWGKRAESLAPYLRKGGQIVAYLEDVHLQTFQKSDGSPASKLTGRISDLELIGGGEAAPAPAPARAAAKPKANASGFDDFDDVPFDL